MAQIPMTPELLQRVAERFKTLAEPARLRILNALRNGRLSVEDEEVLKTRVSNRSSAEASITHVVLTPNNAAAWKINQLRLAEQRFA